ncbi:MAG TPA: hypothetical protein GXZ76_00795 [Clostridiaceae bacterium]|nr:hypothetical protein [Clostridiaceae bacterium]
MNFYNQIKTNSDYIYEKSYTEKNSKFYALVKRNNQKILATTDDDFGNEIEDIHYVPINRNTMSIFKEKFPEFYPITIPEDKQSFGIGDRLGNATAAHLDVIKHYNVFPVLAQQSMRELILTDRTYEDVINSAALSCFEVGYSDGYAADGDHLKELPDILDALRIGCTMITIDCSDKIGDLDVYEDKEGIGFWDNLSDSEQESMLSIKNEFEVVMSKKVSKEEFLKEIWIYYDSIKYINHIYIETSKAGYKDINFEISIDENKSTTTLFGHWFIADMLSGYQFPVFSIAPRFVGEFQKGIDYIGSIEEFKENVKEHYKISNHFGHRLSFHSGSDKFSVFNSIGEIVKQPYHIKIAGTNWLEAVRVISVKNKDLFRKIYEISYENLDKAKKLYDIKTTLQDVKNINDIDESEYASLLDKDAYRQLLHVCYGYILEVAELKEDIMNLLSEEEDFYYSKLGSHFEKHLTELQAPKK